MLVGVYELCLHYQVYSLHDMYILDKKGENLLISGGQVQDLVQVDRFFLIFINFLKNTFFY